MFPTKGDLTRTMKMKHGPQNFKRIRVLLKKKERNDYLVSGVRAKWPRFLSL